MIERRRKKIRGKVAKASDLRIIAETFDGICREFVSKHLQKVPEQKLYHRTKYGVRTKDESEYTSDKPDIVKETDILGSKVIAGLRLEFWGGEEESISVTISDSKLKGYFDNEISVQGPDTIWVNGTFHKLLNCVDSWQSQNTIGTKWKWPLSLGITYLIGLAIVSVISAFSDVLESPFSSPSSAVLPLCGIGFSAFVAEYVAGLWPELEIVPAQEHEQQLQKRRRRLKYILTGIIIPLIIGLIVGYLNR